MTSVHFLAVVVLLHLWVGGPSSSPLQLVFPSSPCGWFPCLLPNERNRFSIAKIWSVSSRSASVFQSWPPFITTSRCHHTFHFENFAGYFQCCLCCYVPRVRELAMNRTRRRHTSKSKRKKGRERVRDSDIDDLTPDTCLSMIV